MRLSYGVILRITQIFLDVRPFARRGEKTNTAPLFYKQEMNTHIEATLR